MNFPYIEGEGEKVRMRNIKYENVLVLLCIKENRTIMRG